MEVEEKVISPHDIENVPVKNEDNLQNITPNVADDIDHLIDPYFSNFSVKVSRKRE